MFREVSLLLAGLAAMSHAAVISESVNKPTQIVADKLEDLKKTQEAQPKVRGAVAKVGDAGCTVDANYSVSDPLPGWFEGTDTTNWPCQYAGTLASNDDGTHQLFFWMYRNADATKPLAIWINGGPGSSSTFGNFLENGPMTITATSTTVDGTTTYDYTMGLRTNGWEGSGYTSWADYAHLVYVDQPVGTGFSYSVNGDLLTTMEETGNEFQTWLTNFMGAFPEFKGRDLYISGESYAGKYIPYYAWKLYETQVDAGDAALWNLKATLTGDPYTAPLTQRMQMWTPPSGLNLVDKSNKPQLAALMKKCAEQLNLDQSLSTQDQKSGEYCADIMSYVGEVDGGVGMENGNVLSYNGQIFEYEWAPIEDAVTNYFTQATNPDNFDTIINAINVQNSTKDPIFQMGSSAVGTAFMGDDMLDYSQYYINLIEHGVKTLIYAGEFDFREGARGVDVWLRTLTWQGSDDFWNSERLVYWIPNMDDNTNNDNIYTNGGLYRTDGTFTWLTVPKAGHFTPTDNYPVTAAFFDDYIKYQGLQEHNVGADNKPSTAMCSYMQDCFGNGVCGANGVCVCNDYWKFGDCSLQATTLVGGYSEAKTEQGPFWYSFVREKGAANQQFTVKSQDHAPVTAYFKIGAQSDPTQFDYDMKFSGITSEMVAFNSNQLTQLQDESGWAVAIFVDAYEGAASPNTLEFTVEFGFKGSMLGVTLPALTLAAASMLHLM